MPTYEYACTSCGHHLEVVQSFTDAPLDTCRRCSGRLRRVFHPAGILFRGPGFYATDHRRGAGGASAKKKDGTTEETSEGASGPAAKPAEKSSGTSEGSKATSTSS
ncbi:MAG: FmdB family zinc ribbon protein [Actinomycetota bacterium]